MLLGFLRAGRPTGSMDPKLCLGGGLEQSSFPPVERFGEQGDHNTRSQAEPDAADIYCCCSSSTAAIEQKLVNTVQSVTDLSFYLMFSRVSKSGFLLLYSFLTSKPGQPRGRC